MADDDDPTPRIPRPRVLTPLQVDDAEEACDRLNVEVLRARAAMIASDARAATAALAICQELLLVIAEAGRDIGVRAPPADLDKLEHCFTPGADVEMPGSAIGEMPTSMGLDLWTHVGHVDVGGRGVNLWARTKP